MLEAGEPVMLLPVLPPESIDCDLVYVIIGLSNSRGDYHTCAESGSG